MPASSHRIPFTVGSRRLLTIEREVATLAFSLQDILSKRIPPVPVLNNVEGLRVLSAPPVAETRLREAMPGFLVGAREEYARSYIDMAGTFEEYLARFSGKTRSTLRRKRRRLEKASGGALDLRAYRTPEEIDTFSQLALPLSRKTYQARLLDAGLPDNDAERAERRALAGNDQVRAFLLFLEGTPVAYLYLPVVRDTLVYAYLGFDPEHASLSPGTVLQMAALEVLFAEDRFRYFDFTEGEGAHKALFGSASVRCASFVMLRPTLANRALLASLKGFDYAIASAKRIAQRTGAEGPIRRLLR
ncbi:GNAT family N-acetyltransferase [Erythrobacter sp. AP23]|uniref:GNAT family N-acetyltransferase n=1 Tax=Erythrobacter sp. AP23 TaxID=499656 RepID=UPI00076D5BC2|nr:GNAT family N-acetyltransferase [Erythrobacter sp. AP23]KWV95589.1 hypothetical protein ASS64_15540 [Erythrobacter sp. AP23]